MKYALKTSVVDVVQWFKNGDHPRDDVFRPFEDTGEIPTEPREGDIVRYFRHPNVSGDTKCAKCGSPMNDHGFLDVNRRANYWMDTGETSVVCPGDYIVETQVNLFIYFSVVSKELFNLVYVKVVEEG